VVGAPSLKVNGVEFPLSELISPLDVVRLRVVRAGEADVVVHDHRLAADTPQHRRGDVALRPVDVPVGMVRVEVPLGPVLEPSGLRGGGSERDDPVVPVHPRCFAIGPTPWVR